MKRNLIFAATVGLLTLSTLVSCKKTKNPTPEVNPDCIIKNIKEIRNEDGSLCKAAQYNDTTITKDISYSPSGDIIQTYTYDKDTVFIHVDYQGTAIKYDAKLTIGSNGRTKTQTAIITWNGGDKSYDTTTYQYDSEGYLIKSISWSPTSFTNSVPDAYEIRETSYEIVNGNLVKEISNSNTSPSYEKDYEYYMDRENKSNIGQDGFPRFDLPFGGKANNNVLKSNYSTSDSLDFSYQYDVNGYITKIKYSNPAMTPTDKYYNLIYDCK
jgi:hypothetical protein